MSFESPNKKIRIEDSPLSSSFEDFEKSPELLEQGARHAGVSPERLKELLARAQERKIAQQTESLEKLAEMNRKIDERHKAEAGLIRQFRHVPRYLRPHMEAFKATPEKLEEAENLETEALELFDKGPELKKIAEELYLEVQKIRLSDRFYELCKDPKIKYPLWRAVFNIREEDERRRKNSPFSREALNKAERELSDMISTYEQKSRQGSTGSAEKFEVNLPLNFPRNPRPRRSNDELEPF